MSEVNKIEIIVQAEVAKALSGLKKVQDETEGLGKKNQTLFDKMKSGYGAVASVLTGVVAVALGVAIKKGIEFLDLQGDFVAQFKNVSKEAIVVRDNLVSAFGLSLEAATKMLATTGRFAQGLGFTSEESLRLAENISKLSVKLADSATNHITAEQAADGLTKALSGQTRGLKDLGIIIDDGDIKREALARGISLATLETDKAAKAQIVFDLALKGSHQTLDAVSISSLSLSEQLQRISALGSSVVTIFGAELAQKLSGIVQSMLQFSQGAGALDKIRVASRKVIEVFTLLVQLLGIGLTGPILLLTDLGIAVFNVAKSFTSLGTIISKAFTDPKGALADFKESFGKAFDNSLTVALVKKNLETIKSLVTDYNATRVEESKGTNEEIIADDTKAFDIRKVLTDEFYAALLVKVKAHEEAVAKLRATQALQTAQIVGNTLTSLFDLATQLNENELAQERAKDDEEVERINKRAELGEITAEEKTKLLDNLAADEEARTKDTKQRLHDLAVAQKAVSIAQIAISTAVAIMQGFGQLGPIGGAIAAVATGITGVAQAAIVLATPIPEFALGGMAGMNGPELVQTGERGPEAILPAELTELLMRAAGSTTNNDNRNINFTANGVQNPVQFINRAQRELGDNVFAGAR